MYLVDTGVLGMVLVHELVGCLVLGMGCCLVGTGYSVGTCTHLVLGWLVGTWLAGILGWYLYMSCTVTDTCKL